MVIEVFSFADLDGIGLDSYKSGNSVLCCEGIEVCGCVLGLDLDLDLHLLDSDIHFLQLFVCFVERYEIPWFFFLSIFHFLLLESR